MCGHHTDAGAGPGVYTSQGEQMGKTLVSVLPIAILCACGTPMVWQGPPGTGAQDLSDTRRDCYGRAQAWRSYNAQVYDQTSIETQVNGQLRAPNYLYRTADQLFQECMLAQGYKLVPQVQ